MVSVPDAVAPAIPRGIVAVQLKLTFPVVGFDKVISELAVPEQIFWFAPEKITFGDGLAVIVTIKELPEQEPDFGVTV